MQLWEGVTRTRVALGSSISLKPEALDSSQIRASWVSYHLYVLVSILLNPARLLLRPRQPAAASLWQEPVFESLGP